MVEKVTAHLAELTQTIDLAIVSKLELANASFTSEQARVTAP